MHIEDLRFRFPGSDHDVLDIDRFSIARGERIFIKGPSGCGKSTLLSLLGGVNVPGKGRISVLDTSVGELRGSERDHFRANHIGFIFQMFNLIPYLSMIDNVTLPCRFSKVRYTNALQRSDKLEQEAVRLLNHLGLDDQVFLQRKVTELSMGQQQRVAAARALIGRPELVIADEPTSSLDADSRESFLQLLFNECEEVEATLVFVSHDQSLQRFFDHTVELAEINRAAQEEIISDDA
ncbi:MAG: ABC transporter ATP-binding protein [Thiotrichales bacterium]|nr:ABC transporter ATP-binding protein [Thiotrichales bacterium]